MKNLGLALKAAIFAAAIFSMAVFVGAAQAAVSASTNLQISATVFQACIIGTTPVTFGNYDPISANQFTPLDAQGSVSVTCPIGATGITIDLDLGQNTQGGNERGMMLDGGGPNPLVYRLFQDPARQNEWRFGANELSAAPGLGIPQSYVVYGRVEPGQVPTIGVYTDTVLATVNF